MRGWKEIVFKPAVGASAYGLCKISNVKEMEQDIRGVCETLLTENDALVQPFQSSVCTKGELSLVFFDHVYSHAALKIPEKNEYRVQGGTKKIYMPSSACIDIALKALQTMAGDKKVLYARIDLLFGDAEDEYLVTEVEFIEPELFFRFAPASSIKLFVDLVCKRIDELNPSRSPTSNTSEKTVHSDISDPTVLEMPTKRVKKFKT